MDVEVSRDDYNPVNRGMIDLVKFRENSRNIFDDERSTSVVGFRKLDPYQVEDHVVQGGNVKRSGIEKKETFRASAGKKEANGGRDERGEGKAVVSNRVHSKEGGRRSQNIQEYGSLVINNNNNKSSIR